MSAGDERLIDLLVHVQAHIDEELSLDALCRFAGRSPSHLHRLFREHLGETPRQHIERLRIELAAFRLLLHDETILGIAVDCGFQSHETFIRAFRRRFGTAPGSYRTETRARALDERRRRLKRAGEAGANGLSRTRVVVLRGMHIAFIRHHGPYESVPLSLFDELDLWASAKPLPGPRLWLGIGLDAPATTRPDKLRFDAALAVAEPFASESGISCRWVEGGSHALTTHVGGFRSLPAAYAAIFERLPSLAGYRPVGLPAIELYRSAPLGALGDVDQTDIYLPVERTGGR